MRLYRAWPRLDLATSAPDAYLRTIMVNTRRSWWRAKWRRESPVAAVPDRPDPAAARDPAERTRLGSLVRSALARLPRQQRAVLVLRYVEDLPEAEVGVAARLLGRDGQDARAPRAAGAARGRSATARRTRPGRGQRNRAVQTVRRGETNRARGRDGTRSWKWTDHAEAEGRAAARGGVRERAGGRRLLRHARSARNCCAGCGGGPRGGGGGCGRWCPPGRSRRWPGRSRWR